MNLCEDPGGIYGSSCSVQACVQKAMNAFWLKVWQTVNKMGFVLWNLSGSLSKVDAALFKQRVAECLDADMAFRLNTAVIVVVVGGGRAVTPLVVHGGGQSCM